MTGPALLDIDGYAELLGVPRSWVRDRVTARDIEFTKVGRHVRFSEANHAANLAAWRQSPIKPIRATNPQPRPIPPPPPPKPPLPPPSRPTGPTGPGRFELIEGGGSDARLDLEQVTA